MVGLRSQRLAEATALLNLLIPDSPGDPVPFIIRGRVKLLQSDFIAAEADFRAALQLDEKSAEAQVFLAELLRDTRRSDEAEPLFRSAMLSAEYQTRAATGLSECLRAKGDFAEAEQLLVAAAARDPKDGAAATELGRLLFENGQYEAAMKRLQLATELRPWSDDAHYLLAQSLSALKRNDEAKPHFDFVDAARKAHSELNRLSDQIAKAPNDVTLLVRTGELLAMYGDPQEAVAVLQSAISLAPDRKDAHRQLADLLARLAKDDPSLQPIADRHRSLSGSSKP